VPGIRFHEVPIETIYLAGNESSHFPVQRTHVFARRASTGPAALAGDDPTASTASTVCGHARVGA
jgi:hypothetical protein